MRFLKLYSKGRDFPSRRSPSTRGKSSVFYGNIPPFVDLSFSTTLLWAKRKKKNFFSFPVLGGRIFTICGRAPELFIILLRGFSPRLHLSGGVWWMRTSNIPNVHIHKPITQGFLPPQKKNFHNEKSYYAKRKKKVRKREKGTSRKTQGKKRSLYYIWVSHAYMFKLKA